MHMPCRPCIAWLRRHRRGLLALLVFCAGMYALGYFSRPVLMPDACKIYGGLLPGLRHIELAECAARAQPCGPCHPTVV